MPPLPSALQNMRLVYWTAERRAWTSTATLIDNVYITKVEPVNGGLQHPVIETIPAVSQVWTHVPPPTSDPAAYFKPSSDSR